MEVPVLGVGLTYFGGLDPVLERCAERIDVLEVEPQTLWFLGPDGSYRPDRDVLERLAAHPSRKLLHGIGFPVGGVRPPHPGQVPPLLSMARTLSPPWMSEHLSFNRAAGPGGEFQTGFLLPPRQSRRGVAAAVASIRAMADALPMPLAVETGVNYLAPRADEMDDGAFVAAVVEEADCGILLDLHNLWTNERNGRQGVDEFLDQIPLDRVWEIHLAGGEEQDGYWLDAHSGPVPGELHELAARVIPRLPNLGALIFEVFPSNLEKVGLGVVERQIENLHRLWDRRESGARVRRSPIRPTPRPATGENGADDGPSPREWEDALGALTVGRPPRTDLECELAADPGVALIRDLLGDFRAGMVARPLKLTCRLLLLTIGREAFEDLLRGYWASEPPRRFASAEAEGLRRYLEEQELGVPHIEAVLAFESAANATLVDDEPRVVAFPCDPLPLLRALAEGRLPDPDLVREGDYEVEVTPESSGAFVVPSADGSSAAADLTAPRTHHR